LHGIVVVVDAAVVDNDGFWNDHITFMRNTFEIWMIAVISKTFYAGVVSVLLSHKTHS